MNSKACGSCGITLAWLYETIEERHRNAQLNGQKYYLAARLIQKVYRDYKARQVLNKKNASAILIQKTFRGYLIRQHFNEILENFLDTKTDLYHNKCAILIQKTFRGFISRHKIHDYYKMRKIQTDTATDLIICVAHKLHHLMRTHQIPGVYSLYDSNCLSKVEQLLTTLKFRTFNNHTKTSFEKQKLSASVTKWPEFDKIRMKVPYGRPCNATEPKNFQEAYSLIDQQKQIKKKPKLFEREPIQLIEKDGNYCNEIMESLIRCELIENEPQNFPVCTEITEKTENIEKFLCEMKAFCKNENLSI